MTPTRKSSILILLVGWGVLCARCAAAEPGQGAVELLEPADGARTMITHPHFMWRGEAMTADRIPECEIQIAVDPEFRTIVNGDIIAVVHRYFPLKALAPGEHWWRVRPVQPVAGAWSAVRRMVVYRPENVIAVPAGSDSEAIRGLLERAIANTPAVLSFERGTYRLDRVDQFMARARGVENLRIEGNGSTLVFNNGTRFLELIETRAVEICDFIFRTQEPSHAVADVLEVDPQSRSIVVQVRPQYPDDLERFVPAGGRNCYLNRVDPLVPGKHLGGFIGGDVARQRLGKGRYRFGPLNERTLGAWEKGAIGVATRYTGDLLHGTSTDLTVLSNLTFIDWGGAIVRQTPNSRLAYLGVKVLCDEKLDAFQGGHASVGNGRIADWVDGCEFHALADDNLNSVCFRTMLLAQKSGTELTVYYDWTVRDVQAGDAMAFVDPVKKRLVGIANVATVARRRSGGRDHFDVVLDKDIGPLIPGLDRERNTHVYNFHSNAFFVERNTKHYAGRGHGAKFRGLCGLIENNDFRNITGSAAIVGEGGDLEGQIARQVLIRNNRFDNCGRTTLMVSSNVGGIEHVAIRDNAIVNSDREGILIRGARHVRIDGNAFSSTKNSGAGVPVVVKESDDVKETGSTRTDPR